MAAISDSVVKMDLLRDLAVTEIPFVNGKVRASCLSCHCETPPATLTEQKARAEQNGTSRTANSLKQDQVGKSASTGKAGGL